MNIKGFGFNWCNFLAIASAVLGNRSAKEVMRGKNSGYYICCHFWEKGKRWTEFGREQLAFADGQIHYQEEPRVSHDMRQSNTNLELWKLRMCLPTISSVPCSSSCQRWVCPWNTNCTLAPMVKRKVKGMTETPYTLPHHREGWVCTKPRNSCEVEIPRTREPWLVFSSLFILKASFNFHS